MKKLTYLLFLAIGVTACSVEPLDSTENLLTADAQMKTQQAEKFMNLKSSEICEGEAPVFVFNFPQDTQGNGNQKETTIKIQIETFPGSDEWVSFKDLSYLGAGPVEFTYEDKILEIGTYSFRVKIGSGGFDYFATLTVKDCCTESFTYVDNGNGSFTFTYIVGENMRAAELIFTFAQGTYISGLSNAFSQNGNNGQTYKAVMDLEKCDVLEYIVTLTANCNGNSKESNLWTDFKVNDISKKGELDNITKSCQQ